MKALESLANQRYLLRLEYEEEKRAYAEAVRKTGVGKLISRGAAWYPVKVGRCYYNSLNQRVIEISRTVGDEIEHGFEYGRPVALFTVASDTAVLSPSASAKGIRATGTIRYADEERLVMTVPESFDIGSLSGREDVGIMLSFDETSYRAMFDALDRVIKGKGRLGELRDLIYSRREAGKLLFTPLRLPYLNAAQQEAVNEVIRAKDIAIVHGPPGTGKTTTLVEAINETLRSEPQVLVCAQSNMAVDWICELLVDRGISVLRLGNPTRVNDKMLSFTYERRFEDHPDYPTLWGIRKVIREMQGMKHRGSDGWHQKMDRLKSRATELEIRINRAILDSAHVIASTLVGSDNKLLDGMKFHSLFIDEAAQALEAAAWIPIRRSHRVILAGDHCQLPPVVKSHEASKGGLSCTLMERITELHPEAVTLLRIQYRMNEEIMRFSSNWFYGGRLEAAPEVKHRGILDYDTPVEWIDTSGIPMEEDCDTDPFREALAGGTMGRYNADEAHLTLSTLQNYIGRIGKERFLEERIDIGIISPYRSQVHLLRRLLKSYPQLKPFRKSISINTVDGFQGQERDVMLISLVRSNDEGNIGFLRDLRRMNVAMTRARMKLIIIGNVPTLTRHPFYRRLHSYCSRLREEGK